MAQKLSKLVIRFYTKGGHPLAAVETQLTLSKGTTVFYGEEEFTITNIVVSILQNEEVQSFTATAVN